MKYIITAIMSLMSLSHACGQKQSPPNIIVVLADDLGYGDLSCYNDSSRISTVNLDRLASGGVQFLDAHSASSVCTPSRYSLLTGRYPWRSRLKSGVLWAYDWPLIEPGLQTMASYFRKSGYRTGITGKWHLGWRWPIREGEFVDTSRFGGRSEEQTLERESKVDFQRTVAGGPMDCGFDYVFSVDIPSLPPFAFIENGKWSGGVPSVMKPEGMSGAKGLMQDGWKSTSMNGRIMEKAFDFIRGASKEPFFLYLPLSLPHQPVAPSPEFSGTSKAGDYGDFVMEMDVYMGRLVSLLRDQGKYENTIIVFTSDNGSVNDAGDSKIRGADWARFGSGYAMFGHLSNGQWRGMKGDAWEGGHRVPLIVHWPARIKGGFRSFNLVGLQDVFATLAALSKLHKGEGLTEDGVDFSPVLLGDTAFKGRDRMVFHSSKGVLSMRLGKWKYIDCDYSGGSLYNPFMPNDQRVGTPGQLYDMEKDPMEKTNLFGQYPSIVERIRSIIR